MKCGVVSIMGRPNVGKSTLLNAILNMKLAITTDKAGTTRNIIQGIYQDDEAQIVFIDTPGIHKAKNKLGTYMVNVATRTLTEVDVILWLVEPTTYIGRGEQEIAKKLNQTKTPVILIINKVDTVKKEEIPTYIQAYKDICPFAEIIPVSALRKINTDTVIDQIFHYLPYGPQYYDEDTVTDQPMRQIVAEMIREKALRCLQEEIPHGIAVTIEKMQERKNGLVDIEASIICERESHKGIIIGKNGAMLKKIASAARFEIERMMEQQINLKVWVKVRKDWRDNDILMKNYGYVEEKK